MDYIRQLGPVVLDHRFRRIMEALLRAAQDVYDARGLEFRSRWASTYRLLHSASQLAVGEIAARLRLTHPGVIGITDEMISAGLVRAVRDEDDGRRRMIALTPKGRRLAPELLGIWKELGAAQRDRFLAAGCDIVPVLDKVDDGFVQRSLAEEVLERLTRKPKGRDQKETSQKPVAKAAARRVRSTAMRSALLFGICGVGSVPMSACTGSGQQTPARSPQVDAPAKEALVSALSDTLINGYIYEKMGRMLADTLRAELRGGAYERISTGESLAQRVTATLRRISNDRHLGVRYGPSPEGAGPVIRRAPPSSGTIQPAPATPQGAEPASPAPRRVRVPEGAEYGFASAEVLPGNIGYLDLRGFSEAPEAMAVADSVMAIFANVKALIIDLGRNGGGGPQIVRYLSAYLFDKPTHLVSTFARGMDAPMERWTSERVGMRRSPRDPLAKTGNRLPTETPWNARHRSKRLPGIPVYILTSRRTFSAAESFTFGLKANNRVTIVGERTGGGGHFGGFVSLPGGFYMFLPRGRTYDPRTNEGWEADGIKPDISVKYEDALKTAIGMIQSR
jgi:DNA-binding MarR family transcriptional regulator